MVEKGLCHPVKQMNTAKGSRLEGQVQAFGFACAGHEVAVRHQGLIKRGGSWKHQM